VRNTASGFGRMREIRQYLVRSGAATDQGSGAQLWSAGTPNAVHAFNPDCERHSHDQSPVGSTPGRPRRGEISCTGLGEGGASSLAAG